MATRNVPLGLLRTFLTLLVVAHHAVLAYHSFAPPAPVSLTAEPRFWMAFPVVDSQRAPGVDLLVGFNDTFFMSLLFLLSGVFAWASLTRKGAAGFVRDRVLRLGVPFLVSAALLAPLAYLPTWLTTPRTTPFWRQWLALGNWPAGPAWFLWVLLAFGLAAAVAFAVAPRFGETLGSVFGRRSPLAFFLLLIATASIVYLPMAAAFDPMHWVSAGPFFVQISRLLHYALYFFVGIALGACGADRGLFAHDGKLARRWPLWALASLLAFGVAIVAFLTIMSTLAKGGPGRGLATFGNFTFVLSCAASSMAALALFVRFARSSNRVLDSLNANAFGIYLLHYVCVSWLQLALLDVPVAGGAKALLVFTGAVGVSWIVSAALRRALAAVLVPRVRELAQAER